MAVQVVFRDGGEVDGAGGGCFVSVVCHAGFHISESKVELDEVVVKDELDKAMINIAGVDGEFTVAGVNSTLDDEVDVEDSKERATPIPCTIHHARCNGLMDEHAPHKTFVPLVRVRHLRLGLRGTTKR